MLRQDLQKGASRVLTALEDTSLTLIMRGMLDREKTVQSEEILAAFSHYMQLYQGFTSIERQVVEILGLNILHNMKFWALLMAGEEMRGHPELFETSNKLRFAQEHLPRFLTLLKREADDVPSVTTKAQGEETAASVAILTVRVLEETGTSSPTRLVFMLESIQGLYDAASQVLREKGDDLSVIGCDSGSDKSFDFLGAGWLSFLVWEGKWK